jgi:hypothetical protein
MLLIARSAIVRAVEFGRWLQAPPVENGHLAGCLYFAGLAEIRRAMAELAKNAS